MMNKKAAMFGLDARIALAIFGSISLVATAKIHSSINNSRASKVITDMKELAKSYEAYYLDTRTSLAPLNASTSHYLHFSLKSEGLAINPGVKRWSGPYTSLPKHSGSPYLDMSSKGYVFARFLTLKHSVSWGNAEEWLSKSSSWCDTSEECYLWVSYTGAEPNDPTIEILDDIIDGSDGPDAGDYRWRHPTIDGHPWKTQTYLKSIAIKSPLAQ